jgi:hypothetical protein
MKTPHLYCRAYYVKEFRRFSGWKEDLSDLRQESLWQGGTRVDGKRNQLADDDVLYLHEGLTVTDGIFCGEHVVFAGTGEAWAKFCLEELGFSVPDWAATAARLTPSS